MTEPHDISESPHVPRYALYRGKRMRVLYYRSNGYFVLLGPRDERFDVHRDKFTFLKSKAG